MHSVVAQRGRTAKQRSDVSRPVALALADELIQAGMSVFDYGCGRGADVAGLKALGVSASGWDPHHAPNQPKVPADVVNLGYVVNVIEDPEERDAVLREAWSLSKGLLIVAARLDWDVHHGQVLPLGDGVLTSSGTFQKFFTQDELRQWMEDALATEAVAAGPGIFYVFRSEQLREQHRSRGVRRIAPSRRSIPPTALLDGNRELLDPLYSFLVQRGRLPLSGELDQEQGLRRTFGSLARAVTLLRRVTDAAPWEAAAVSRQRDLMVYLALGGFRRRPQFSALPRDLQADIKAFFGSYRKATDLGKELLFSAGQQKAISEESAESPVGKLLPDALYVHVDAVSELPVLLRVYEGCAKALLGDVPGATIVKLRRDKPKVSYLCYPMFEEDAHPELSETFVADLRRLRTHHRDYRSSDNPPVLHRKECFISGTHPQREHFADLSAAEQEAGLLEDANVIGTRAGWHTRLEDRGYKVVGHSLQKLG